MRLTITRLFFLLFFSAFAAHAQDSAPAQEPVVQPPDPAGQDPDAGGRLPTLPSDQPPLPPDAQPVPLEIPVVHEDEPVWSGTLERIATGVVSIRVDSTRAFDTEWNSSSQATGFVVDAERGIILTNRHVVTPGPVVAEAIFLNNEEVELKPVY